MRSTQGKVKRIARSRHHAVAGEAPPPTPCRRRFQPARTGTRDQVPKANHGWRAFARHDVVAAPSLQVQ